MAIIDKLYRNKLLAQTPSWVKEMSDEELNQTISQMESQNSQAQKQGIASSIGDLGNIFLQKGGLQPVKSETNNINDYIQKELIRQQFEQQNNELKSNREKQQIEDFIKSHPGATPSGFTMGGQRFDFNTPAEIAKKEASDKKTDFLNSSKLREQLFDKQEVKDYINISTQVRSMDSLLEKAKSGDLQNNAALDQALITMFNKLTDPQSVVRESEYARTPQNLPLWNAFSGAFQKLERGGAGLTNKDRQALVWGAKVIANERGKTFNDTVSRYEGYANEYGINTKFITGELNKHKDYDTYVPGLTKPTTNDGWSDLGNGIRIREKK